MATPKAKLEERIAKLEAKVESLEEKLTVEPATAKPWWESIVGVFARDEDFQEAMRLGREYRESLRPQPIIAKSAKAGKRINVRA
jgi:hypothetical protein